MSGLILEQVARELQTECPQDNLSLGCWTIQSIADLRGATREAEALLNVLDANELVPLPFSKISCARYHQAKGYGSAASRHCGLVQAVRGFHFSAPKDHLRPCRPSVDSCTSYGIAMHSLKSSAPGCGGALCGLCSAMGCQPRA